MFEFKSVNVSVEYFKTFVKHVLKIIAVDVEVKF